MSSPRMSQKVVVAVVYVCAMVLNSLDATSITVALSTLSREFDVSPASMEAVVLGYLASLAVFIPVSGWFGDRFGTKRTFLVALAIFTFGSALCALAGSLSELVAFRIVQGIGGGMLTPVGMAMLYRTFPPAERVGVGRVLMFATILGPALGPVIAGGILNEWAWQWIFLFKVPIGVAAIVFGALFLQESKEEHAGRFDLAGFLLGGAGFALVLFSLSEGPERGWGSPLILVTGASGLVALGAFAWVELRQPEPMIQLRLLRNRLFGSTLSVSFFGTAGFLGVLFLVPLYLQEVIRLSPFETGITTAPEAIGVVASTQVVARIYPRIGPRRLMSAGLLWVTTVIVLMSFIQRDTNLWLIRLLMFALGCGMAFIFLPNQAASLATISKRETGQATVLSNVCRQLGSATGVALLSSLLAGVGAVTIASDGTSEPNMTAYRVAFMGAAGLALIGALVAQRVPDEDAAETMSRSVTVAKSSAASSPRAR